MCLRVREYEVQWTNASFDFHQMAVHKRTTMLAHCNLKQNMWLCSKQSCFFSFYALPSGGKSKDAVVHCSVGRTKINKKRTGLAHIKIKKRDGECQGDKQSFPNRKFRPFFNLSTHLEAKNDNWTSVTGLGVLKVLSHKFSDNSSPNIWQHFEIVPV